MNPLVSIVISCYNRKDFIAETLNSCLAQTFKDFEIVIVDDGSTDDSLSVINSYTTIPNVTFIRQQNGGPGSARNRGILNAKGKYIVTLDSDDMLREDHLQLMVDSMGDREDLIVTSWLRLLRNNGSIENAPWAHVPTSYKDAITRNFCICCSMFSKTAWQNINGFDENRVLISREDWDFWIRLYQSGCEVKVIEDYLLLYRIHDNSLSTGSSLKIQEAENYLRSKHTI
jgi:glycosyltransferase involved in cell wall biosynthesis